MLCPEMRGGMDGSTSPLHPSLAACQCNVHVDEGGTTTWVAYTKGLLWLATTGFSPLPTHLGGFEGGWGCVLMYLQREGILRSAYCGMTKRKKKMVVLPITRSVAQNRFREGGSKVEGSREWV